jgi:hypothetical protein
MEAFSAGDTILFSNCFHMGGEPVFFDLEHICPGNVETGLDASQTHDTSIKPLPNQRGSIGSGGNFPLLGRKFVLFDSKFIGAILKLAFSSGIADRTVKRMVDEQKLQSLKPHLFDALRPGMNDHAVDHGRCTGGHGHLCALHIDQTDATGFEQA